ncbi:MAG: hypothetical protein VX836_10760, partial [Pseudomonadota bacterium]|nr:hypothetical protein [Pseudomonadota bacterium]
TAPIFYLLRPLIFNLNVTSFSVTDVTSIGSVDFTGLPALFSVGNSITEMNAGCTGGVCQFDFRVNDNFIDALDIYDRWKGNQDIPFSSPYPISHEWTVEKRYGE